MNKFIKFNKEQLEGLHLSVLREIGRQIGVKAPAGKNKLGLISAILAIQSKTAQPVPPNKRGAPPKIFIDVSEFYANDDNVNYTDKPYKKGLEFCDSQPESDIFTVEGVLEQHLSGYGFLRTNNYENSKDDIYVSNQNIRKYNLRRGDKIKATARIVREGDSAALQEVLAIDDLEPNLFLKRTSFDDLLPYYPTDRIKLETEGENNDLSIRLIDLFCPLGMGQRGLIVAPPKTGKTTLLKYIAQSIEKNYKDVKLIMLLIDERPEEVTDIKRSVKGEVVFSTFDEGPEHHIRAAELVINRAKRLVEVGQNVVILMDSITRLARAYNNTIESSGKILSGGLDPVAMQGPKRFFGAARNIENGGSLTIVSTALIVMLLPLTNEPAILPFYGAIAVAIILARELIVSGFRIVAASNGKVLAADKSGKIKTFVQDIAVIILLLSADFMPGLYSTLNIVGLCFLGLATLLTIYSGIECIVKNIDVLKENK